MSRRRRWSDLPPELLAVVSGRLHDPADFVRFHAVCKLWLESLPPSMVLRPIFFYWLIAPVSGRQMKLRCVLSKTSYRALARTSFSRNNPVAHADGTACWFFSVFPKPRLVDPLTGKDKALPLFHGRWMKKSRGVIYGDGTIFLYNFSVSDHAEYTFFRGAILAPGDTTWKFVETQLDMDMEDEEFENHHFLATYRVHDGKTLVGVDGYPWHLLPPPAGESQDKCEKILEGEVLNDDWCVESCHVLESRGELLRVSVLIERGEYHGSVGKRGAFQAHVLSVSVHALEEEVDAKGRHTVRWTRRDGRSFVDRVMFLGFPTSFAVEASRFGGMEDDVSGGCVYFVQRRSDDLPGVFRYNLVDRKAKFLRRLPREWKHRQNDTLLWLQPQPCIAPVQVIRERLQTLKIGDPTKIISAIRVEIPPTYYMKFLISFVVRNLAPGVDSSSLHRFFNKHGKVSDAAVTSQGKGFVSMAMTTLYEHYEAEDVLDGLLWDGYTLEVRKRQLQQASSVWPPPMKQ